MARTRFNAPNIGNCSLVYYSELGSSVSVSGPIYFPWSFDPTLYGLTATDLNGTYSFDCNGCTYTVLVTEYCNARSITYSVLDMCSVRSITYSVLDMCSVRSITYSVLDM